MYHAELRRISPHHKQYRILDSMHLKPDQQYKIWSENSNLSLHVNAFTRYFQVGIVAVNLIGDKLGTLAPGALDIPPAAYGAGHRSTAAFAPGHGGSAFGAGRAGRNELNDLSFDMNFDPETAQRIRNIAAAKEKAVRSEVCKLPQDIVRSKRGVFVQVRPVSIRYICAYMYKCVFFCHTFSIPPLPREKCFSRNQPILQYPPARYAPCTLVLRIGS